MWNAASKSLNAPYGARCFLTTENAPTNNAEGTRLNAPYGARCFLTKKHPSDQQARCQISRLFLAIRRIATDSQNSAERAGNSHQRRRVATQPTHTRHNHQKHHTQTPGPTAPHSATNPGLVTENKPPRSTRSTWLPDHSHTRGQRPNPYDSDSLEYPSTQPQEPHPYART